jgi:hypothetical protein
MGIIKQAFGRPAAKVQKRQDNSSRSDTDPPNPAARAGEAGDSEHVLSGRDKSHANRWRNRWFSKEVPKNRADKILHHAQELVQQRPSAHPSEKWPAFAHDQAQAQQQEEHINHRIGNFLVERAMASIQNEDQQEHDEPSSCIMWPEQTSPPNANPSPPSDHVDLQHRTAEILSQAPQTVDHNTPHTTTPIESNGQTVQPKQEPSVRLSQKFETQTQAQPRRSRTDLERQATSAIDQALAQIRQEIKFLELSLTLPNHLQHRRTMIETELKALTVKKEQLKKKRAIEHRAAKLAFVPVEEVQLPIATSLKPDPHQKTSANLEAENQAMLQRGIELSLQSLPPAAGSSSNQEMPSAQAMKTWLNEVHQRIEDLQQSLLLSSMREPQRSEKTPKSAKQLELEKLIQVEKQLQQDLHAQGVVLSDHPIQPASEPLRFKHVGSTVPPPPPPLPTRNSIPRRAQAIHNTVNQAVANLDAPELPPQIYEWMHQEAPLAADGSDLSKKSGRRTRIRLAAREWAVGIQDPNCAHLRMRKTHCTSLPTPIPKSVKRLDLSQNPYLRQPIDLSNRQMSSVNLTGCIRMKTHPNFAGTQVSQEIRLQGCPLESFSADILNQPIECIIYVTPSALSEQARQDLKNAGVHLETGINPNGPQFIFVKPITK